MFIVLPVGMNYRTGRLPVVTFTLIGINALVYLVSLFFFFSAGASGEKWRPGRPFPAGLAPISRDDF
jgi:hypothetical protein